jgi:NitT/TauT family transport system permease protein
MTSTATPDPAAAGGQAEGGGRDSALPAAPGGGGAARTARGPAQATGNAARQACGRRARLAYGCLGIAVMLASWQVLALLMSPAVMASPLDTARALAGLALDGTLGRQLLVTLRRLLVGLTLGASAGAALGVVAGLRPVVRAFLEPWRWVGMTTPAVVIAVFAMLWFGLGDVSVMLIVALITAPVMFVNTLAGVQALDARLLDMSRVYRFPRRLRLTEIYLPGIGLPLLAGLTLAAGIGVRAVVLGEVLAAMDGVGYAFSRAMSYLNAPDLFAWMLSLLALMAVLEFAALRPLRKRALRGSGEREG